MKYTATVHFRQHGLGEFTTELVRFYHVTMREKVNDVLQAGINCVEDGETIFIPPSQILKIVVTPILP